MVAFKQVSGIAAIVLSLIYISAFVFYGAFWDFPSTDDALTQIMYITDHYFVTSFFMFVTYILFGLVLSVLVASIHQILRGKSRILCSLATAYGYIWVALVIASGMVAMSGLSFATDASIEAPTKTIETWTLLMTIAQSIGGDNEIVGAIWVLLISFLALRHKVMSAKLHLWGIIVGFVGVLTVLPLSLMTELFGVFQIIWFFWLGVCLINLSRDRFSE